MPGLINLYNNPTTTPITHEDGGSGDDEDYADGYMTYADVDQEFEQLLRNTEGVDINVITPNGGPSSLTNNGTAEELNGVEED